MEKPIVLVIMDGVGKGDGGSGDAVKVAKTPTLDHQLGTLGIDLAAAQSVVANLGVAHIIIAGQTDGGAVGLQISVGAGCQKTVQSGGLGLHNSIAAAAVTLTNAVHNNHYNGFHRKKYLQESISP